MFNKLSIGLWVMDSAYNYDASKDAALQKLEKASEIEGLNGVELVYPTHVNEKNYKEVKQFCGDKNIQVMSVNPNVWDGEDFQKGAFTSGDPAARKRAVDYSKTAVDLGKELGAGQMCLWPGQDGFDYPFQDNYEAMWQYEKDGIKAVADYDKNYKIAIEYKAREPRSHILLDSTSTVLMFSKLIKAENVGVNLDFGHALLAGENPGEAVVKSMNAGKLFGVHINDNYGNTDEDMIFASVHHIETLEFIYYLRKLKYDGWISQEFDARKVDPIKACSHCFNTLKVFENIADKIDIKALLEAQKNSDSLESQKIIAGAMLGGEMYGK